MEEKKITGEEIDEKTGRLFAEKIVRDIRDILAKASSETEAISLILKYVEENKLRYAGMKINKAGSATFMVRTTDHGQHTVNLTTRFHG